MGLYCFSFIDSLKDGKPYKLEIQSFGCYSKSLITLDITKKTRGYLAILREESSSIHSDKVSHKRRSKYLTASDLDSLSQLEQLVADVHFEFISTQIMPGNPECRWSRDYKFNTALSTKEFIDFSCAVDWLDVLKRIFK